MIPVPGRAYVQTRVWSRGRAALSGRQPDDPKILSLIVVDYHWNEHRKIKA